MNDKLVMDKENKANPKKKGTSGIVIDDVTFHRCVKLGAFDVDRTINFIPPDGEFELMKYRITENVNLPFRVIPVITEHGRSRVEYEIKIKGNFSNKLFATHVILKIPTPPMVSKTNLTPGLGKAKYNESQQCIIWKIKKFPGDASYVFKGECKMLTGMEDKPWSKPPMTMEFQVPMFTASGLHVRFMKVFERSNYETVKWSVERDRCARACARFVTIDAHTG
jgi:AP-2 complex subunit mu-1